jgi:hypothetical protein
VPFDLDPDPIPAALVTEPPDAPDVEALVGFVGTGREGHVRLYADAALTVWMEIPVGDIRHRYRIPEERDCCGGRSIIWVTGERMRTELNPEPAEQLQREFLVGPISAGLLVPGTLLEAAERLTFRATRSFTLMGLSFRHCP